MIKGKTEAEASDVAAPTASTQPPVGGEGATPSVGVDASGPSAAVVGAVEGAAEASVGDATCGAAAPAVPGETEKGDQTAVAAPKEDDPAPVQPEIIKPSETSDTPAPTAPVAAEGGTEGQEACVVDPKGEVDTAGADTQEEQGGLSEAHLAELKKSKGPFGGLFKNPCLQAEVKTPADGEADPNTSAEPEATDKAETAEDETVPKSTDEAPSQAAPVAEEQAPPAETPSGDSRKSKRGIFSRFRKSESGIPPGVTGAEPATPVAETGGDGDPQAPAAPSPSEGAAPTVMGDAPKAPEDAGGSEKVEDKAPDVPPEESKPKKSIFNFLRKSSLPDSGAPDTDVAASAPEVCGDADTEAPATCTEGAVECASADASKPPADAVAGEAKAGDEQGQATEPSKPVKETKARKSFTLFRKPSMPDSGAAGGNVAASATEAPGDADTKAPAAPTEAAAPSTIDPAEAKPEDAATDPKPEDAQAGEAEAPTADAKPKKRSIVGSLFRKPSMPDPEAGGTEAPAPAPDKAGAPEPEPVSDATADAENPTVKPEGGQEGCQEGGQGGGQEEASAEKTKRKIFPNIFSRKPSMPDSGAADAEKTEPAQEVPGDADTKAPASAEGVGTTDTDQPAVPAPEGGEKPKGDEAEPEEQAPVAITTPTADAKKSRRFNLFKRRSLSNAEAAAASIAGEASAPAVDAPAPSAPTTSGDAAVPSSSADAPAQSSSADVPAPPGAPEGECNIEVGAQDAPAEAQATTPETSSAKKSRMPFGRLFSRRLNAAGAEPTTAAPEESGEGEIAAKSGDASQPSGEASAPSASTDPPASSGDAPEAANVAEADPSAPKDAKTDTPATAPDSSSSNVKKSSRIFSRLMRRPSQKDIEVPAADVASKSEAITGTDTSAPAVPEPNVKPHAPADLDGKPTPATAEVTVP